jgi:putative exporter of polyketide antibiotics
VGADVSPFTYVPAVPAETFQWLPVLVLLAITATLGDRSAT